MMSLASICLDCEVERLFFSAATVKMSTSRAGSCVCCGIYKTNNVFSHDTKGDNYEDCNAAITRTARSRIRGHFYRTIGIATNVRGVMTESVIVDDFGGTTTMHRIP